MLIADDNRDTVLTLSEILRADGHDTKACHDGNEVLACIREYEPDVVLLDIVLPGRNGWDLARSIRAGATAAVRLLIGISGEYTQGADRLLARMNGFDFYMLKPCDPKVLLKLLEKKGSPG